MAEIRTETDGSMTLVLTSGTKVQLGPLASTEDADVKALRNLSTTLVELVKDLDDRVAKLERGQRFCR